MKTKPTVIYMAITLLVGCAPRQPAFERTVPLEGQSNFRDIGGYETEDGRTVKTGILYRSGELHALTNDDVQTLENLGVETVVSFLIPAEIEVRGADRVPEGTKEVALPIEAGGGLVQAVGEARITGDFSKVPADLNPRLHEMAAAEAKAQYAALIREIIAANGKPLAYHCSHGVHRTGTATAIILSAVGVPWETVREDYLLSNECRAEEIGNRTEELRLAAAETFGIAPATVDMTNINAFYILEGDYIDGTLNYIKETYDDMGTYLEKGLGLKAEEIAQLKKLLLE
ncbi:tyrosine-protein phosphatase [Pontiellaceae bacterium B12227]|nr:tyrosine-protein phosphatase [Pontiellaceae bacterium B12227]